MKTPCPVCGQPTTVRKDNTLRLHHVRGKPCDGSGQAVLVQLLGALS